MKTSKYLKAGLLTAGLVGGTMALAANNVTGSADITLSASIGGVAQISGARSSLEFNNLINENNPPILDDNICLFSNTGSLGLTISGLNDSNVGGNLVNDDYTVVQGVPIPGMKQLPYTVSFAPEENAVSGFNVLTPGAQTTIDAASGALSSDFCVQSAAPTATIRVAVDMSNAPNHDYGDYSDTLHLFVTPILPGSGGGPHVFN